MTVVTRLPVDPDRAPASGSWARQLLAALGLPMTRNNETFLMLWAQAEGGFRQGAAHWNPLNTTQPAAGATDYNSVGVKNYPSERAGIAATAATLNNGRYGAVLDALRRSDIKAAAKAVVASPWGTKPHPLLDLVGETTDGNAVGQGITGGAATGIADGAVDAVKTVGDLIAVLTNQGTWVRVLYVVGGLGLVVGGFVLIVKTGAGSKAGGAVAGAVPGAVATKVVTAVPKAAAAAV